MLSAGSWSSDLAWTSAPRDVSPEDIAAARRFAQRNAIDETEFATFAAMLGIEAA